MAVCDAEFKLRRDSVYSTTTALTLVPLTYILRLITPATMHACYRGYRDTRMLASDNAYARRMNTSPPITIHRSATSHP